MTKHATLVAALAIAGAAVLYAQTKPNFGGTWMGISPETRGATIRVKHDGATLSTGHDSTGDGHVATYKLDGSESRNTLDTHGGIVSVTKASWAGNTAVIVGTTTYADGRKEERKQTWSLDEKGNLVIELVITRANNETEKRVAIYARR